MVYFQHFWEIIYKIIHIWHLFDRFHQTCLTQIITLSHYLVCCHGLRKHYFLFFFWLACLPVLVCSVEVELIGREERTRRNSDSVLYPGVKEELSILKIKRIQAAFNQIMAVMEKEIEEVSLKVFGDRSAKRQQTTFGKIPYELEGNDVNSVWVHITTYLKA